MTKLKFVKQSNHLIGLLFALIYILVGCNHQQEKLKSKILYTGISYVSAIDSVSFNYESESWKGSNSDYNDYRYGQNIFVDSSKSFRYVSINSENELHFFDFHTNEHSYSKPICNDKIDAYKIDSSLIYLLYNNIFYVKDYQLKTLDSFVYKQPNIRYQHDIDFSIENSSNLFKIKQYFVLMYYVIDKTGEYRNTKYLFHYFNKEVSFFANKMCDELDTSFQYFRFPAVTSDNNFLYHTPRVLNCVSKSNELKTVKHVAIDTAKNNYLSLDHEDQYHISRLKKYRFSTDYNKDLICSGDNVYLLKEFTKEKSFKNGIQVYKHNLELIKFDKKLNKLKSIYIKENLYDYALIFNKRLYLFNFQKNKYYIYDI